MKTAKKPANIPQKDWDTVDSPELTDDEFKGARPAKEVLPEGLYNALVARRRGQRGPQKAPVKVALKLRVDPDVVEAYKASGPGWQSRMNDVLRHGMKRQARKA
ncbi:MAG TPA: BrnA antitoxin family protein [Bryobacteraceae bacterium]|nr:BrnA antitoxin family protein [Bryobacteraceae bacterium]